MSEESSKQVIDTMPTKAFFVDMLTRDIELDRAVLDLVDNSVDGAKRLRTEHPPNFDGLNVVISMSASSFKMSDNCGGFDVATAKDYAFRFGRAPGAKATPYSIGQFGVGMKRALFKFGRYFSIISVTATERWKVQVDVDDWERGPDWKFEFAEIAADISVPENERGTEIEVIRLRPEVSVKFGSDHFQRTLADMIRTYQRQFLAAGLSITFNGKHLVNTDLWLLVGDVAPAIIEFDYEPTDGKPVRVRIVAGVGVSNPSEAGWYVVCNGRVVLASDRSEVTGWGLVAEQSKEIPKYHNQYARFRGVVYFDSEDSGQLPWNTTKDGVDSDSPLWRLTLEKMVVLSREIINFLNEVDREISEHGKDGPIQRSLAAAARKEVDTLKGSAPFRRPDPSKSHAPARTRISYSRDNEHIEYLKEALGVSSAKAVGEKTFDIAFRDQKGD